MFTIVIIAFFSLIGLLILHELSHFLAAKSFQVKVEEFGIGYPPRLLGKKIGETIYSLNLLPFGAFIRIPDEKLNSRPIWQRFVIMVAGVFSFWFFCAMLLSFVLMIGAPIQIDDSAIDFADPHVRILTVSPASPAAESGLAPGDLIMEFKSQLSGERQIDKLAEFQDLVQQNKGEKVILILERGKEKREITVIPRISPPAGEGALGVSLARIGIKKYPLGEALVGGMRETFTLTITIVVGLARAVGNLFLKKPTGLELVGPVGIMNIFVQTGSLGISYFLQTMAFISLNLAIFNALPLPVADGGKIFLLALEKIRKKPLNEKTEQKIYNVFFFLLLGLMIFATVKDVIKLF